MTEPMDLSPDEQTRIRAEEELRARVRAEIHERHLRETRPNYWTGFILNALVIGTGFFVIKEIVWGVIWILLAIVLFAATSGYSWLIIGLCSLIHYRFTYAKKYKIPTERMWDATNVRLLLLVIGLVAFAMILSYIRPNLDY